MINRRNFLTKIGSILGALPLISTTKPTVEEKTVDRLRDFTASLQDRMPSHEDMKYPWKWSRSVPEPCNPTCSGPCECYPPEEDEIYTC